MGNYVLRQGQDRIRADGPTQTMALSHPGGLMNMDLHSDDFSWDYAMFNEAGVRVASGGGTLTLGTVMPAGSYTIYATYNGSELNSQTSDIQWTVRSTNEQPDRTPPGHRQPPRRFGSNKTPGPIARALRWMTGRG